jgi:hypothetical protein
MASRPRVLAAVVALLVGALGLVSFIGGTGPDAGAEPGCGLTIDDVDGPRPAYLLPGQTLDAFPASGAMCRGLWLPRADRWFVPQGVALDPGARTAWVSGYRWRPGYGNRPCQLVHVDLRTGRRLAFVPRVEGRVGTAPTVFCRHGGGLARTRAGLWLAETQRLWLLDRAGEVRRVWRVERPVSGGFLVHGRHGRVGLGDFDKRRDSTTHWFRLADVLAPGVTTLAKSDAVRTSVAPRHAQGGAVRPGDVAPYLTSSLSTCGLLVTPTGERTAFAPGVEGIAFAGRDRVWAVLEAGARPYQRDGRALTPMLARFDVDALDRQPAATCGWE